MASLLCSLILPQDAEGIPDILITQIQHQTNALRLFLTKYCTLQIMWLFSNEIAIISSILQLQSCTLESQFSIIRRVTSFSIASISSLMSCSNSMAVLGWSTQAVTCSWGIPRESSHKRTNHDILQTNEHHHSSKSDLQQKIRLCCSVRLLSWRRRKVWRSRPRYPNSCARPFSSDLIRLHLLGSRNTSLQNDGSAHHTVDFTLCRNWWSWREFSCVK